MGRSADVRYLDVVDEDLVGRRSYSITVLENYSRAVLASAVSPTQDLSAFLSVLHRAVEKHGSPEALVTDSGSVFRANRAKAVYGALGVRKEEIERGRPWQSYLETAFNVQRRIADHHFAKASSWPELVRTPAEVLGRLREVRRPEDLNRAFFSERSVRVLDPSGYAVWRRWRVYGEEGLAGREAALWLREKTLTVEHAGEPLSRYEVEFVDGTEKPRALARPVLFETTVMLPQPKLFGLASLGETGWLKTLMLEDYAPRRRAQPESLQQALFAYHEAWG